MDYNTIRKNNRSWQYLLYMLGCNSSSELDKMYEGDELMAEVIKNIKAKVDDFDKLLYYNREVLDEGNPFQDALEDGIRMGIDRGRNIGFEEGIEHGVEQGVKQGLKQGVKQGLKQGVEKGLKQGIIKTVKAMLKESCDINLISRVTNLSVKEVQKLKEESI